MQLEKATLTAEIKVTGTAPALIDDFRAALPTAHDQTDTSTVIESAPGVFEQTFELVRPACWGHFRSDLTKSLDKAKHVCGAGLSFEIVDCTRHVVERRTKEEAATSSRRRMKTTYAPGCKPAAKSKLQGAA